MKHLKRFNESIKDTIINDVKDMLLELQDIGFKIIVKKEKEDDSFGKHTMHKKDELYILLDGYELWQDKEGNTRRGSHDFLGKYKDMKDTILRILYYLKDNNFKEIGLANIDYNIDKFIELFEKSNNAINTIELRVRN